MQTKLLRQTRLTELKVSVVADWAGETSNGPGIARPRIDLFGFVKEDFIGCSPSIVGPETQSDSGQPLLPGQANGNLMVLLIRLPLLDKHTVSQCESMAGGH